MKKKQILRTCKACKATRYLDPSLQSIKKIPKEMTPFRSLLVANGEALQREGVRQTAILVLSCPSPSCGSTSYTDSTVRI